MKNIITNRLAPRPIGQLWRHRKDGFVVSLDVWLDNIGTWNARRLDNGWLDIIADAILERDYEVVK